MVLIMLRLSVQVFAVADRDHENGPRLLLNVANKPEVAKPVFPVPLERAGIALAQAARIVVRPQPRFDEFLDAPLLLAVESPESLVCRR